MRGRTAAPETGLPRCDGEAAAAEEAVAAGAAGDDDLDELRVELIRELDRLAADG